MRRFCCCALIRGRVWKGLGVDENVREMLRRQRRCPRRILMPLWEKDERRLDYFFNLKKGKRVVDVLGNSPAFLSDCGANGQSGLDGECE